MSGYQITGLNKNYYNAKRLENTFSVRLKILTGNVKCTKDCTEETPQKNIAQLHDHDSKSDQQTSQQMAQNNQNILTGT